MFREARDILGRNRVKLNIMIFKDGPEQRLGYGLEGLGVAARFPVTVRDFVLLHSVQTGCGVHPASCIMGTVGCFPGGEGDQSPPSCAEVKNGGYLHLFIRPHSVMLN